MKSKRFRKISRSISKNTLNKREPNDNVNNSMM